MRGATLLALLLGMLFAATGEALFGVPPAARPVIAAPTPLLAPRLAPPLTAAPPRPQATLRQEPSFTEIGARACEDCYGPMGVGLPVLSGTRAAP